MRPDLLDPKDRQKSLNPGDEHAKRYDVAGGLAELERHANSSTEDPNEVSWKNNYQGGDKSLKDDDKKIDPSANISAAKAQEVNSPNWTTNVGGASKSKATITIKTLFGKKAPVVLIGAVLGVGGGISFLSPALLPLQLRAVAENFYGNSSRAAPAHFKQTMRYRIGNQAACSNGAGLRCKMATVNDKSMERYAKEGFKLDSEKVGDRHIIKSATFPDGTKVNSGDDFIKHMDASTSAASKVFNVFNPRSGPYVGRNFTTKVLQKFGLAKNRITLSGKDREALARSFNREVGLPESNDPDERERAAAATGGDVESKLNDRAKAGGRITNVLGIACGAYDLSRAAVGLVKIKNAAKYVAFGWFFLKLADQIRAGDVDPTTIATGGAMLTAVASSGPNAGKTATDSPGYHAMADGDRGKLTTSMQGILLGGNTALIKIDDSLTAIKNALGTKTAHAGCKATNNIVTGTALSAAICGGSGAAAGTVVPILGNVVGGIGGVAVCTVASVFTGLASSAIISFIIGQIMPSIINYLSSVNLSFDMPPVDMGNAITIGAGLLFAGTGLSSGMKLGKKGEVSSFNKAVFEDDKQYDAVARYDARSTPFDVTNQYSFMGQFVSQVGLDKSTGGNPIMSTLSSVGSILSSARSSLFTTAAYAADMPSPLKDDTLGKCPDPELAQKDLGCDIMGQPQTVQTASEMTEDEGANLDYMISNGYVADNTEGTVNPDKDYAKFLKYCTNEGESLPGTSILSLEDDDYDWPDSRCQDQDDEMSNFRTYTSRVSGVDDEDTQYEEGATDAAVTPGAGTVDGDDYAKEVTSVLGRSGTGQCVDFVLFRLVKHKVLDGPVALGNGKDVVGTLGRMGYKVDTTPAVHSVMSTSHTSHPDLGHTAMVAKVNSDGSIVVEEYNFTNPLHYDTRTISAADVKAAGMTFAHTEVDYK